jgi:Fic family protein
MSGLKRKTGHYVSSIAGGENVRAYVPDPLPPDPPIQIHELLSRLSAADHAIGRLDGISILLPDKNLFLYMYVRKEAVLSSQIEGTQSTLDDLLLFETLAEAGKPIDDIREVSNYVDAMMHGLERLSTLPLSLRLIREMHEKLLQSGRGQAKNPGEFRRSQNWIGGTRPGRATFVPPPHEQVMPALGALEKFIHDNTSDLPPLVKAGLIHVQFETIHPFLDGNGRLGRLLITLFLCSQKVLQQPLLYLSLYFKTKRADYYRLLQEVREDGAWEAWLDFFLDGVAQTANAAFSAATRIHALIRKDRERIGTEADRASSVLRVHEVMQTSPFLTAPQAGAKTSLTKPTVNAAFEQLQRLGIVREITNRQRGRVYAYTAYLALLNEGGELLDETGTMKAATVSDGGEPTKRVREKKAAAKPRKA